MTTWPDAFSIRLEIIASSCTLPLRSWNDSKSLREVLEEARYSQKEFGDQLVAVEHFLIACLRNGRSQRCLLNAPPVPSLQDVVKAIKEIRGDRRVTSQFAESMYEALEKYGRDHTDAAKKGELDPVICRDEEIRCIIQILSRCQKNNHVFLGEPDVGKTAVEEGLAQRIVSGDVSSSSIANRRLIGLDMGALVVDELVEGAEYDADDVDDTDGDSNHRFNDTDSEIHDVDDTDGDSNRCFEDTDSEIHDVDEDTADVVGTIPKEPPATAVVNGSIPDVLEWALRYEESNPPNDMIASLASSTVRLGDIITIKSWGGGQYEEECYSRLHEMAVHFTAIAEYVLRCALIAALQPDKAESSIMNLPNTSIESTVVGEKGKPLVFSGV
ncbi:unnamed protein product [Agarophyton chilense]